jgi:photosystem I P700 chlorophyll a apoprotein A1
MIICSPKPEVKILVDRDPVKTSFEEWVRPGHFSRTIAKGPDTTIWIWNLHADAHDFAVNKLGIIKTPNHPM